MKHKNQIEQEQSIIDRMVLIAHQTAKALGKIGIENEDYSPSNQFINELLNMLDVVMFRSIKAHTELSMDEIDDLVDKANEKMKQFGLLTN